MFRRAVCNSLFGGMSVGSVWKDGGFSDSRGKFCILYLSMISDLGVNTPLTTRDNHGANQLFQSHCYTNDSSVKKVNQIIYRYALQ